MVFCNKVIYGDKKCSKTCHNPYFNRWFSAISILTVKESAKSSHNPYFNRWFSAIRHQTLN